MEDELAKRRMAKALNDKMEKDYNEALENQRRGDVHRSIPKKEGFNWIDNDLERKKAERSLEKSKGEVNKYFDEVRGEQNEHLQKRRDKLGDFHKKQLENDPKLSEDFDQSGREEFLMDWKVKAGEEQKDREIESGKIKERFNKELERQKEYSRKRREKEIADREAGRDFWDTNEGEHFSKEWTKGTKERAIKNEIPKIQAENAKLTGAKDLLILGALESARPAVAGEGSDTLPPEEQKKKDEFNKKARFAQAAKGKK